MGIPHDWKLWTRLKKKSVPFTPRLNKSSEAPFHAISGDLLLGQTRAQWQPVGMSPTRFLGTIFFNISEFPRLTGFHWKSLKSRVMPVHDVFNDIPRDFIFCKSHMETPLDWNFRTRLKKNQFHKFHNFHSNYW